MTQPHLGYPLGGGAWLITAVVKNKSVPLAFSAEQAVEIARRITAYYGVKHDNYNSQDNSQVHGLSQATNKPDKTPTD